MQHNILWLLFFGACENNEKLEQEEVIVLVDNDGDGFDEATDCDDNNGSVNPDAEEICDSLDNNCDGDIDEGVLNVFYEDSDSDGYGNVDSTISACEPPEGFVSDNTDCDDNNTDIAPEKDESCDGIDNNCDGDIDEDVLLSFYIDLDRDGFGAEGQVEYACELTEGLAENDYDCDDSNSAIHPDAEEVCDNIDNNCNLQIDELVQTTWYLDSDGDGFGTTDSSLEACTQPVDYVTDNTDCDDGSALAYPGMIEFCDGIDNNCDAQIDESGAVGELTYYEDSDGDGFGNPNSSLASCEIPTNYVLDNTDCNDLAIDINPDSTEYCNGLDDDCNGITDESTAVDTTIWYLDYDSDGFGGNLFTLDSCDQPAGYVATQNDCDDTDSFTNPDASEICDSIDNDCDGAIDDADADFDTSTLYTFYLDTDGDGYGDTNALSTGCTVPDDHVELGGDCDEADISIHPGALEVCDAIDNDCDGDIDDADSNLDTSTGATFYLDDDLDGFGDSTLSTEACVAPSGYVDIDGDCDDGEITTYPNAEELCDNIDNSCSGVVDDAEALGTGGTCAAVDCQQILDNYAATDGFYWLETSNGPEEHQCEMDSEGGGWTLVWSFENTNVPSYGSSFWTDTSSTGDPSTVNSYRSILAGEFAFSEVLHTIHPVSDPSDRIEVAVDFTSEISSLVDAFGGGTQLSNSHQVLEGVLEIQYTGYEWGFNLSCSSYGGGNVRFGQGHGSSCNVFYGLGCTGGIYCGVPDFYSTFMASNTARYYPSSDVYTTFGSVQQLWVR